MTVHTFHISAAPQASPWPLPGDFRVSLVLLEDLTSSDAEGGGGGNEVT